MSTSSFGSRASYATLLRSRFTSVTPGTRSPRRAEPVAATVTATASDIVLLLYGRVAPDAVAIQGDRDAVERFLLPIG